MLISCVSQHIFSKFKFIKSYLRLTTREGILNNLSIIFINHEVFKIINFEAIINDFFLKKQEGRKHYTMPQVPLYVDP